VYLTDTQLIDSHFPRSFYLVGGPITSPRKPWEIYSAVFSQTTDYVVFLTPSQQCQSTEGKVCVPYTLYDIVACTGSNRGSSFSVLVLFSHIAVLPTYVDVAYCYRWSSVVCPSVCLSITIVSPAETAELMEMPFGLWTVA